MKIERYETQEQEKEEWQERTVKDDMSSSIRKRGGQEESRCVVELRYSVKGNTWNDPFSPPLSLPFSPLPFSHTFSPLLSPILSPLSPPSLPVKHPDPSAAPRSIRHARTGVN
jgi:hypothetical protein